MYKCMKLLNGYVFGEKISGIEVTGVGRYKGYQPNFSDENKRVSLPIFSIHGNHDYPSNDFGRLSINDLLHTTHYLNYFGKQLDLS